MKIYVTLRELNKSFELTATVWQIQNVLRILGIPISVSMDIMEMLKLDVMERMSHDSIRQQLDEAIAGWKPDPADFPRFYDQMEDSDPFDAVVAILTAFATHMEEKGKAKQEQADPPPPTEIPLETPFQQTPT